MKRVRTTFYCDVCRAEIDEDEGRTDYRGRHFGLCESCSCTHGLRTFPLSGSFVVQIVPLADGAASFKTEEPNP